MANKLLRVQHFFIKLRQPKLTSIILALSLRIFKTFKKLASKKKEKTVEKKNLRKVKKIQK